MANKKDSSALKHISMYLILSFIITMVVFYITSLGVEFKLIFNYLKSPLTFFSNFIAIFLFVIIFSAIFNSVKKSFILNLIIWTLISLVNELKIYYRQEVFKYPDLALIREAFDIFKKYKIYKNKIFIIYMIIIIVLIVLAIYFLKDLKFTKKQRIKGSLISLALFSLLLTTGFYNYDYYMKLGQKSELNMWNQVDSYRAKGVIYSFLYDTKYMKNQTYKDYNKREAQKTLSQYKYEDIKEDQEVTYVAIMLESFKDFAEFASDDFVYDYDPYGYFHELEEKSITGTLVPDVYGGGTINTEYQMLSGYRNQPSYNTKRNTYISYFNDQGYYTEGLHPNDGSFYNRTSAYENIGFQDFKHRGNHFKYLDYYKCDEVFFHEVVKVLNKQKDNSFIFGVTLQNHGPYYERKENHDIYYIKDLPHYNKNDYEYFNNYLAGIHDTSKRLEYLVDEIDKNEKPVVLLLFGDHSPTIPESLYNMLGMNVVESDITGYLNKYKTPFLVYGNSAAKTKFNKSFEGKFASEYYNPMFLMPVITEYLGIRGSDYNQFLQEMSHHVPLFIEDVVYSENNKLKKTASDEAEDYIHMFHNVETYYKRQKIKK